MVEYAGKPFKVVDVDTTVGIQRVEEGDKVEYVVVDTGEKFEAYVFKIHGKALEFAVLNEQGTRKYDLEDIALVLEGDDV